MTTNARFDPELVRVSNDGKSVFISDEYGPYVRAVRSRDRATDQDLHSAQQSLGRISISAGRRRNQHQHERAHRQQGHGGARAHAGRQDAGRHHAGVAHSGFHQRQSGQEDGAHRDDRHRERRHQGIRLQPDSSGSGVSDIVALNDHQFLVDERDGNGLANGNDAVAKQLFIIDTNGATDVTDLSGQALKDAAIPKSGPFLDIVAALGAAGIPPSEVPAKIEGLAFGPDVDVDGEVEHTLYVSNDNDFLSQVPLADGTLVDNPNQFFVFGFTDADLAKFGVDEFVPQESPPFPSRRPGR